MALLFINRVENGEDIFADLHLNTIRRNKPGPVGCPYYDNPGEIEPENKALMNFLSKNKIIKFENFEEFKTEINKNVLKEKDDSKKNSKIIEDSNSETSKEESSESNDKVNKENTLTENIIKKKRKDSFHVFY